MKGSSYGAAFLYVIMKVMEELLIQRVVGLKNRLFVKCGGYSYKEFLARGMKIARAIIFAQ